MTLCAQLHRRLGAFVLDATIEAAAGEVVALVGPNGAGKSTVLNLLAGLDTLDAGAILLDGAELDSPERGVLVAPEQRPVAIVFQDYLLFAHLDAVENVAFGLRARGMSRRDARHQAVRWLERVGLFERRHARPAQLSGGQQQRVALARALAVRPRLLLLDEPLAALDVGTRHDVRRDLRRHLDEFDGITLMVTHDPVDAFALADRVVILEEGTVVQGGRLDEVVAHPRSPYIAELIGVNLMRGQLCEGVLRLPSGAELMVADDGAGEYFAAIATTSIALYGTRPEGSPRNVWQGVVTDVDERGHRVRVSLAGPVALVAEITQEARRSLVLAPGKQPWVSIKATEIAVYPA